ncbi:MAG: GNAT family N-acetyltransferase [Alphaproteobacteria bacterium]|nr:GNAT family N-acetyltransferase [Alphaproteobacteria bacterium]MBV9153830.1 GNAT family N-acetyltransferase [Alphaproteobacteria bacterium]
MRIELIDSDAGLQALIPEWAALWRRVPTSAPFQSPLWLTAWWSQFGTGIPRIITARAGGALIGVLPLYELHETDSIKLLPLGISVSDYIDALIDPAYPDIPDLLLAAIADIIFSQQCHLPDLPPDAALRRAASPHNLREICDPGPPCPVLILPADPDDLAAVVPRKTLRDVRQAQSRSEAVGPVTIETADLSTVDGALEALFCLHQKRWRKRGEEGVLADPAVRRFHHEAASAFCAAGILRLYELRIGTTLAGVYYGFHSNRKAYAYLGGFDPEMTRLSPGAQLLQHAICAAIHEGAREFHFLRGGESYKYAWGATDQFNLARTFRRP